MSEWTHLQLLGWLGYLVSLYMLCRHLPMRQLLNNKLTQHLLFGSAACVFFLWMCRTGIYTGLNVHFLWLTALLLLLGFRWAMLSGLIALLGITLAGQESWSMFGINGLLSVTCPLALSYLIYNLSFHKLPKHFFVYVFVCAFVPGALMIAIKMFLLGGFYHLDGQHSWMIIQDNYLILIPLMLFPEGMLNGMTMTLLIMYKPQWVYTFYDKYYLDNN